MEQAEIIQDMLDTAKGSGLEIEVLISLINNISDDDLDLAQECDHALLEWDI